jgi:hypothetical protein
LEKLIFVETVIAHVRSKTLEGKLKWKSSVSSITAEPTAAIYVMINFNDDGIDSAIWESVMIKHPVGKGVTALGNPASDKSRLYDPITFTETLNQMNEIFRYVLLEPRKKEFEAAMKELGK